MWNEPLKTFGVLHIVALIIAFAMIHFGAILGKKYRYSIYKEKIIKVLGITGLVLLGLEIFKQVFTVVTTGWAAEWIPYQICTMDMYVLCAIPFIKNENIRKYFIGFVAYISLSAATFYFFKPAAALNAKYIIITFHSLLWHWILIGIGSFSMVSFELNKKEELKSFIGTLGVFAVLTIIAVLMNEIFNRVGQDVNFFYINSKNETFYPVLNMIFNPNPRPYIVYIISFIIYFSMGSGVFCLLSILQNRYIGRSKFRQNK